ncbi:MAG TPA: PIN domain-containing protein [Acidovorax defluvii]|nr:PIN domain-containing protein [Acidovorax defluvii]
MSTELKLYFDTCCFLDMLQHTTGITPKSERAAHVFYLRQFLELARAKGAVVYTSMLTVAECQFASDESDKSNVKKILTQDVKRLIDAMLLSGKSGVLPAQATPNIVRASRDLRWVHGTNFKPLDALHIATALKLGCSHFITTDTKLDAKSKLIVTALGLAFCTADALKDLLPSEYRQLPIDPALATKPSPKPRKPKK